MNFNNLMMQRWLCQGTETTIVSETLPKKVPVLLSVQRISWQYLIPAFPWLTVHCHIQPGNKEMLVHWCIQPRCNRSTMLAMFICFQCARAENTSQLHLRLYSAILPQRTHGGVNFDFYGQLSRGKILTEFCRYLQTLQTFFSFMYTKGLLQAMILFWPTKKVPHLILTCSLNHCVCDPGLVPGLSSRGYKICPTDQKVLLVFLTCGLLSDESWKHG